MGVEKKKDRIEIFISKQFYEKGEIMRKQPNKKERKKQKTKKKEKRKERKAKQKKDNW